jgi:CHASE3 domain sensor protein
MAGFVAFAVLLAVNAFVTRRMLDTQTELGLWVIHTEGVETALGQTQSLLGDAEISERDYLLTGNAKFLAPYQSSSAQIDGRIDALTTLTADNPVQQRNIAELRPLLRKKLDDMAQAVALSGGGNAATAKAAVLSDQGTPVVDPVRRIFAEMSAEEARLGGLRTPAYQRSKRMTVISIWLSSLMAVLGVAGLAWLVLSRRASRERYERQLRQREESFRVTLTSIGDAVIATDAQGKVDFLNPEAERLTGRKLSDAGGKDIKEVFPIFNDYQALRASRRASADHFNPQHGQPMIQAH